jgi:hypothetical protein
MALRALSTLSWTPPNEPRAGGIGIVTYGSLFGITRIRVTYKHSNGGFLILTTADLATLEFPQLIDVTYTDYHGSFDIEKNSSLTSIDLPVFQRYIGGNLVISNNPILTSINLPHWLPESGLFCSFTLNALDATTVNLILARCVANPTFGTVPFSAVYLNGGSNAAPSGQGIIDKGVLIVRGATVVTN